jgi:hypothetical protein
VPTIYPDGYVRWWARKCFAHPTAQGRDDDDELVHHDLHAVARLDLGVGFEAVENAKTFGGAVDA